MNSSSELVLVDVLCERAECSKKFQVRLVILHRLRLSPWAHASLPLASHSASSLQLWFSFHSVFVDFPFFVATLNGHSRDLVVPRPLTPGGTCSLTRSRPLLSSGANKIFIRFSGRLLDDHWLNWWYRWRLWRLCVWMYSITRSGTVAVVPHPVVTDHHRHSLELVSVEARVIEIMVVIAHAIHFQFLLFLFHQQWRSWGQLWWQSR